MLSTYVNAKCNKHGLVPTFAKVSEEGNNRMLQYRYTVSCNPMVNAFVAKDLGNDTERINMRAAQLGAVYRSKFSQLPRGSNACIVWELQRLQKIII